MTQDDLDRDLDGILGNLPEAEPPGDLAGRIVSHAISHSQVRPGGAVMNILAALVSPWPADMGQKAAVLGLVALLMFGAGLSCADGGGRGTDAALLSLMYMDNAEVF